ncbi:MAG: phosphatidate cytidylyltransferase [Saprospiraceae bacterium]|nr:phosphatidate cytidylyltransferase [Candidatus Vicinibacter affinis]
MLMTIVCSVILSMLYDDLTLFQWMGWAIIVSLSATLGDLAESLLKRSIHIKDSGSILPGHGGFLDRFDGFVIAVPFSIAYLWVLNFFNLDLGTPNKNDV